MNIKDPANWTAFESNTKIHYTSDYGQFRFLRGNRDLNEGKVNKIIKSVNDGLNFFKYCPILVNEEYYIIDGQHRFVSCKKLKLPIFFVIVPNFSLRQIAEINNNQSKWKIRDFMNCYIDADHNKQHYQELERIAGEYKINLSAAITMLMYGKVGAGGSSEAFRDGNFKVNFLDQTIKLLNLAKDYDPYGADWKQRAFLQAIEKLVASEKYDHAAVLKKFDKHSMKVEPQSTCKEYLVHIEELYNFKNSIRQILY
ncbi:ParB-like nuclease domain-containing protein [bacterium]|nr:ParB-like nuclease domain-containing protein [bacterium]